MKKHSQFYESFYDEIFILEQNSRNHKFFAMKAWSYTVLKVDHFEGFSNLME